MVSINELHLVYPLKSDWAHIFCSVYFCANDSDAFI